MVKMSLMQVTCSFFMITAADNLTAHCSWTRMRHQYRYVKHDGVKGMKTGASLNYPDEDLTWIHQNFNQRKRNLKNYYKKKAGCLEVWLDTWNQSCSESLLEFPHVPDKQYQYFNGKDQDQPWLNHEHIPKRGATSVTLTFCDVTGGLPHI